MNPLLQRFLISWAAGVAATGVVVSTSKKPHRLKRRRRKKKGKAAEPVQIGAQALLDARAPADPGMSVQEWAAGVKALPSRVASIFQRVPKSPPEGAREPDEIRTADGQKVATGAGNKKRRRGKRKKATLWDSARESMRQTVHEVVKEEVKDTPVGNAVDAARKAGDRVKEGAAVVKEGAAVVAENAVKVGAQVGDKAKGLLNRILRAVEADPAPNADPEAEALAEQEANAHAPVAVAADAPVVEGNQADGHGAVSPAATSAPIEAESAAAAPVPGVDVVEVGKKLKSGLNAVGDWLSGPGAPGYTSSRVRPAQDGADVVEAKDAQPAGAAPSEGRRDAGDDQRDEEHAAGEDEGPDRRRDEAGE